MTNNSKQLTRNFWITEFPKTPDIRLVLGIQEERTNRGRPITIVDNSKYRLSFLCDKKKETFGIPEREDIPALGTRFFHDRERITLPFFNEADANIRAVIIALFQCGFVEGENNDTLFGAFYRMNFNPWCSMFLHWCWQKAGVTGPVKYGLASSRESYRQMPVKKTDPLKLVSGDGLFWGNNGKPTGHTALCVWNDTASRIVYTIEGNSGDSVSLRKYTYNALTNAKRTFLGGGSHSSYRKNINLLDTTAGFSRNDKTR